MKIEQILENLQPRDINCEWTLDGAIENADEDGTFRLYPNSTQRSFFYLIKCCDVDGDVHEWTEAELQSLGRIDEIRYRIRVKTGSLVRSVQIDTFIAGVASPTQQHKNKVAMSNSSPCNCNCREGQRCVADYNGSCRCYD